MGLREKILQDIKEALKKKDKPRLTILRFLQAQIQNKEIEKGKKKLSDEEVILLITAQIKKLKESAVLFKKGKRENLVAQTKAEIEVLKTYLPKQLSDKELKKEVEKIIAQNPSIIQPGPLIGLAVKTLAGRADNQRIAQMVKIVLK